MISKLKKEWFKLFNKGKILEEDFTVIELKCDLINMDTGNYTTYNMATNFEVESPTLEEINDKLSSSFIRKNLLKFTSFFYMIKFNKDIDELMNFISAIQSFDCDYIVKELDHIVVILLKIDGDKLSDVFNTKELYNPVIKKIRNNLCYINKGYIIDRIEHEVILEDECCTEDLNSAKDNLILYLSKVNITKESLGETFGLVEKDAKILKDINLPKFFDKNEILQLVGTPTFYIKKNSNVYEELIPYIQNVDMLFETSEVSYIKFNTIQNFIKWSNDINVLIKDTMVNFITSLYKIENLNGFRLNQYDEPVSEEYMYVEVIED